MRRQPICRFLVLAAVIAAQALVVHDPVSAQFVPDRPSATLARIPALVYEVWPADFDGDGITDLVGGRSDGDLVFRHGQGDGTFALEHVIADGLGMPLGVGDLNHDGRVDVIASAAPSGDDTLFILPGKGDGTFAAPLAPGFALGAPAYVVDVDGDGTRDLVGLRGDTIRLFRGRRDFTFDPAVDLRAGLLAQHMIPADLNSDGLVDLVAITLWGRSIDLFLNAGGSTFTHSTIAIGRAGLGLTARDMNNDGLIDLIASAGDLASPTSQYWVSGFVLVLLGHGDGTFAEPLSFPTNNGPRTVVAGDFNGDGLTDVATGNLSYTLACEVIQLWDSVSMLPGSGDGRLGPPASYALGNSEDLTDAVLYRRKHHRLTTSDLNADGRTDLIASPGAILLSTVPTPNRSPVADAGEPLLIPHPDRVTLRGNAVDADDDWLSFEWTDATGTVVGRVPGSCVVGYSGEQRFTLTVSDGHGGVSTDSVVHTFSAPPSLPPGWNEANIGSSTGSSSFDGATYTVTGAGADIWGTTDAFRFVYSTVSGDFDVSVRVTSVQQVHDWTKAGLMIRDGFGAQARHASAFATPSSVNGLAFQRRELIGGASSHTAGPAVSPPVWLRLTRNGNAISGYARTAIEDEWTFIGTQAFTAGLPDSLQVGLAVTSHVDGTPATATFDNFALTAIAPALPEGWTSGDVGSVGAAGDVAYDGASFTVRGAGADVWGTVDAFHYAHSVVSGDFDVAVRVASAQPLHEWTKAGLMMRDGLSAQARHAFVFATPSAQNGVAFQRRDIVGGGSLHTAGPAVAPPVWLRLRREGGLVTAYARTAAVSEWTLIDTQTFPGLPPSVHLGLAVSSHVEGLTATAVFDNLATTPSALPEGWTSRDIGDVAAPGWASYQNGTFAVGGSGADIWFASDEFHFAYTMFVGDFTIVARVLSLDDTDPWAKAGLMVRDGLSPQASHGSAFVTPANGVAFQSRDGFAAATEHLAGPARGAPIWLRLERTSAELIASYRTDGETEWTPIGTRTFDRLSDTLLVGLAVTSHADRIVASALFDNVRTTADAGAEWTAIDVGGPGVAGSTIVDGDTYTLRASGADIWGTSDAFQFVHQPLAGDGSITARVAGLEGLDAWTKAGVMIRTSLDPSSSHAFAFVSLNEGLAFQRRLTEGGITTHTGGGAMTAPQWVRLTRTGDTIVAFSSADGTTWVEIGRDVFPAMPRDVLAGLALTSHDDTMLATATFDRLLVQSSGVPLAMVSPPPGTALRKTGVTFEWNGAGDEFWLDVGSAPGRADLYASGPLGQTTRHTVTGLPLNGSALHVQVRRRIGTVIDTVSVQYTAPIRRTLAVITDFRDRHLEDYTGAGMKTEEDVAQQLRKMEDHWAFLSRGLEAVHWEIMRIELPYDSPDADPDPFDGNWTAFREAAAIEIRKRVLIDDYDVDSDGELDAAWLILAHGGLDIGSAIGGGSVNLGVNMFVDGQASLSVTSGATGNFNHELGHLLGLRDTYGTYDTVHGLTLMSFSWPLPPHDFSAFERVKLGWVKPRVITATTRGVWLPSAHDVLAAVLIPTGLSDEYFLLEYRRRPDSGYGSAYFLPYNGLAVYHVLESSDGGRLPPLLKLEPADGVSTYDGVLHHDDFVSPDNPALLRPLVLRGYFGDSPEIFRIENVEWRDGGIAFDIVMPEEVRSPTVSTAETSR
jgi:M6 family metalloprotease-like protein